MPLLRRSVLVFCLATAPAVAEDVSRCTAAEARQATRAAAADVLKPLVENLLAEIEPSRLVLESARSPTAPLLAAAPSATSKEDGP